MVNDLVNQPLAGLQVRSLFELTMRLIQVGAK
jgi:hypothetical protein